MSWDAMLADEETRNNPAWGFEQYKTRNPRMLAYSGPTLRTVWADAITWYRDRLLEWENLDQRTVILELRKGEQSLFFPLFRDDPTVWLECPRDGRVVVTAEGYCDQCTYEFDK